MTHSALASFIVIIYCSVWESFHSWRRGKVCSPLSVSGLSNFLFKPWWFQIFQ